MKISGWWLNGTKREYVLNEEFLQKISLDHVDGV